MSAEATAIELDDDKFHDECGLFGIWNHAEAANVVYLGLYALQHRGQESAGIASTDGDHFQVEKAMGWVADVFSRDRLKRLPGHRSIGHVRYSTAGSSNLRNAQPITGTTAHGPVAIAHNGNLVNAEALREELEKDGAVFQSSSDTEVILHLLARSEGATLVEQLARALTRVRGAYTLLLLTPTAVIGVRDPSGFRPLTLGRLDDAWVLPRRALDPLDEVERDEPRDPGDRRCGLTSMRPFRPAQRLQCVRVRVPRGRLGAWNVHAVRKALGHQLAREYPVVADLVIAVPDSGVGAALGYSEESGLPYDVGLVRNHYVGRTFIEPQQGIRHFGVKVKLNPNREVLDGKRVVVIDDSIVRGTTSRKIVKMIRAAGAREVHVRISSPPIQWPCYYGIDTPTRRELIGSSHKVDEIQRYLGADSLGYLSLEGMLKAAGSDPNAVTGFTGLPRRDRG
jgi:amidophosphoribosyltransferase